MGYNNYNGSRTGTRRKKVKWDRVIIAGLLFIFVMYLLIRGVGKLISSSKSSDSSAKEASVNSASSDSVSDKNDSSSVPAVQYNFTVCVDPGHGGEDGGTVSLDGNRLEKDDNLRISLKLRDYLKAYGVNVVMTREDDTFVELVDRTDMANKNKCDFFVCMHRNAFTEEMRGVEMFVNNAEPKADTALAKNILDGLDKVGISQNRGVSYGFGGDTSLNYHINIYTLMPSCLVELGFLTDDKDNQDFDAHIDEYAKAVADAIVKSAVDLGVTDSNGKRLMDGPFFTDDKKLAADAKQRAQQNTNVNIEQ